MRITPAAQISPGQDGAIWGGYLFRFDHRGYCRVHRMHTWECIGSFTLDRTEHLTPHSNAVVFGCEYYTPGDEFPLLYTNIYNNYAGTDDPHIGVCCVYRIMREGDRFTSCLVQLLEVGFSADTDLWASPGGDIRPYGNFVIDREKGRLWAFVMRDAPHTTRYMAFSLPRASEGSPDPILGVPRRVLTATEMLDFFDVPYHHFIQGACMHEGRIWSVEGFTDSTENPPGLRIIDPASRSQLLYQNFMDLGIREEAECIDFADGICWYSDAAGLLYTLETE